jgi:hypothetical protein
MKGGDGLYASYFIFLGFLCSLRNRVFLYECTWETKMEREIVQWLGPDPGSIVCSYCQHWGQEIIRVTDDNAYDLLGTPSGSDSYFMMSLASPTVVHHYTRGHYSLCLSEHRTNIQKLLILHHQPDQNGEFMFASVGNMEMKIWLGVTCKQTTALRPYVPFIGRVRVRIIDRERQVVELTDGSIALDTENGIGVYLRGRFHRTLKPKGNILKIISLPHERLLSISCHDNHIACNVWKGRKCLSTFHIETIHIDDFPVNWHWYKTNNYACALRNGSLVVNVNSAHFQHERYYVDIWCIRKHDNVSENWERRVRQEWNHRLSCFVECDNDELLIGFWLGYVGIMSTATFSRKCDQKLWFTGDSACITSLCRLPNGDVVTANAVGMVYIWDLHCETPKRTHHFHVSPMNEITRLQFNSVDNTLMCLVQSYGVVTFQL